MAKKNIFCWRNIIILILLTFILFYIIWLEIITYQLKSIKEEMRAAGNPVTFEDLAEIAAQNENRENALEYIIEAGNIEKWQISPDVSGIGTAKTISAPPELPYGYMPADFFDMTEQDRLNLKKYLKDNQTQLDSLCKAMNIGWYQGRIKWEDGLDLILPPLAIIKEATKLAKYKAIDLIFDGRIDEAIEWLSRWHSVIYNSLNNEPRYLIHDLVSFSELGLLDDCIFWLLREKELTNEQLSKQYSAINIFDHHQIIKRAVQNNSVYILTELTQLDASNYSGGYKVVRLIFTYSGLNKLNAGRYSEFYERYMGACQLPFYDTYKESKTIDHDIEKLAKKIIYKPLNTASPYNHFIFLTGMILSKENILKVIIANEMHKNDNGSYADSLEILKQYKPDLEINDIFTKTDTLGYKPVTVNGKTEEYFIWSRTDKTDIEIQSIIDNMISENMDTVNDLPDSISKEHLRIYRVKTK